MTKPLNRSTAISTPRTLWTIVRFATAVALVVAIVSQLVATIQYAHTAGHHLATEVANHLSYFTVLSTAAGAVVLLIGGFWLAGHLRDDEREPRWLSILFLVVGSAVVITGIVYNLLLRNDGVPDPDTLTWASEIKHVVAPITFAGELVLHVARERLRWRDSLFALVFPIAWAAYTLLRGEQITNQLTGEPWWYPYGFLDPHRVAGGVSGVALYIVGIAAALAGIAALAVWFSRLRHRAQAA